MESLDNVSVAILNKVNHLAERHGIPPYEFVAALSYNDKHKTVLSYESPAPEAPDMRDRYLRMLRDLGLDHDNYELVGDDKDIFAALDRALARAPQPRTR